MNPENWLQKLMADFLSWRFANFLARGPVQAQQNVALMRPGADFGVPQLDDIVFSVPLWERGQNELRVD